MKRFFYGTRRYHPLRWQGCLFHERQTETFNFTAVVGAVLCEGQQANVLGEAPVTPHRRGDRGCREKKNFPLVGVWEYSLW